MILQWASSGNDTCTLVPQIQTDKALFFLCACSWDSCIISEPRWGSQHATAYSKYKSWRILKTEDDVLEEKKKNNGLKHFVRADTRAASRSEWRPRDYFTLSVPAVVLSERGKSALRKLYSSLLVSTYSEQFSFFQVKPQLPHSRFSTPSRALSLFFRALRHRVVVFSPRTAAHRKRVVSKQVPVIVSTPCSGPQS